MRLLWCFEGIENITPFDWLQETTGNIWASQEGASVDEVRLRGFLSHVLISYS